ncbi:hypothetical protein [Lysobacter brunescens]
MSALEAGSIRALVEIIRNEIDEAQFNAFVVVSIFMEAFDLDLTQVRELPGAECLGGGAHTDDEINEIVWPHLEQWIESNRRKQQAR